MYTYIHIYMNIITNCGNWMRELMGGWPYKCWWFIQLDWINGKLMEFERHSLELNVGPVRCVLGSTSPFFFRPNPLQSKKYDYFNPPVHFNFILIQNLWPIQNTPLQTSPIIPVETWVVRPHFVTYPMVFSWITHINGSKKCKASLENHFTWRIPRNNLVTMGDEPF